MEFERINGNSNGNANGMIYNNRLGWEERDYGGGGGGGGGGEKFFPVSSPSTSSAPSSSSSSPPRYIEHQVTKLDTLAGIAIRYGVEVADIKKMNGLVTDLQMFALKTLHIPLPGKHPPSPCLPNGHTSSGRTSYEKTPNRVRSEFLESFQSLRLAPECRVSPAMSSLQGYYGLHGGRDLSEGCEMMGYNKRSGNGHEDEMFTTSSSPMNPPLSLHRKSRSVANGFNAEDCDPTYDTGTNVDRWVQKLSWRRLKSEADFSRTPEKLLKEENGSGGWFSAITGKGLALRTKASSRTNLVASEAEANGFPTCLGIVSEGSSTVRKSSSTSSLQDQDNGGSLSIWSTSKWSALKPDLQAALGKPIFDGLSNPITGRKAKTALD